MSSIFRQTAVITKMNLLSLPQRLWTSLSVVIAITFVVFVLLGALALNNGFEKTMNGSGSDSVALILRAGSVSEINSTLNREQQQLLDTAPGIAKENGKPIVSRESIIIVDGTKKSTGTKANLPLRGVSRNAFSVRDGVKLVSGRMFSPGSNEIVIGESVLSNFDGFELGKEKRLGSNVWKVVGIFQAGGSVFESELWADISTVQSLFGFGDNVQSVRARLDGSNALGSLEKFNQNDVRLRTKIQTEKEYFAAQAQGTSDLITLVGKPLSLVMAIGALAGALNAMYTSVASRSEETATLRTIGFGGIPTFFGTLAEALVLALIGGAIGTVAAILIFNGMSASTLSGNFTQMVFKLSLTQSQIIEAAIWAIFLGLLGGVFPAWRAARQSIASTGE